MAVRTFNLRGVVFAPKESYRVRPAKRGPERTQAQPQTKSLSLPAGKLAVTARKITTAPLGLAWLLVIGAAVGLVSLLVTTRDSVTAEAIRREVADFVICMRLMVPALSVFGLVLLEEAVSYAKGNSHS